MSNDEKVFEHESYGMIGISRVTASGRTTLFGSSLERHPIQMQITVRRAKRYHSLGRDGYYGGKEIVRLVLSPAQFAEMISNPNTGFGVPCTLRHIEGHQLAPPPPVETEAQEVRQRFMLDTQALVEKAKEGAAKVAAVLEASKLPKSAKAAIQDVFVEATRFLSDAAPFLVSSFQEAVQRTVIEAKQEIDAFMTHSIHAAGVKAIQESGQDSMARLMLDDPVDSSDSDA